MNIFKSFIERCKGVMRRRRFTMHNVENGSEEWHVLVSPAGIAAGFTALTLLIFAIVLALVAYTPVVEFLPGYKTDATRSRESLMNSIMRLDSIERLMNDMMIYNENIAVVTGGSTPAVRTTIAADSVYRDKALVAPSPEDSVLRRQMERSGILQGGPSVTVRENSGMTSPADGIITERPDPRNGRYGIRMATTSMAQVVSVADGTVMAALWTPDRGHIVEIQHDNGFVSRYRNLHQTIVSQGQVVRGNEVVGYTASEPAQDGSNQFELELWSGGKAVDPETYIIF